MHAIILAGGKGSRLSPILQNLPKPMAPIAGKPFLEYLVRYLAQTGIHTMTLSVGFKAENIQAYFGDGSKWGVKVSYCYEEEPLGTGGAFRKAAEMLGEEELLLLNGDSFLNLDINALVSFHRAKRSLVTLSLVSLSQSHRYGSVEMNGEGQVVAFHEKLETEKCLINGGIYVIQRKAMVHEIPHGEVSLETQIFPRLVKAGKIFGMLAEGYFVDIGIPQAYLELACDHQSLLRAVHS